MLRRIAAVALASSSAQVAIPDAVARAAKEAPSATWSAESALVADFTFDGVPDVALLGLEPRAVRVAVVEGPISARSRIHTLRFPVGASQGGICGAAGEARLVRESPGLAEDCSPTDEPCVALEERLRAAGDKGGSGLALENGNDGCDRFHIVYDRSRLVWTRL